MTCQTEKVHFDMSVIAPDHDELKCPIMDCVSEFHVIFISCRGNVSRVPDQAQEPVEWIQWDPSASALLQEPLYLLITSIIGLPSIMQDKYFTDISEDPANIRNILSDVQTLSILHWTSQTF